MSWRQAESPFNISFKSGCKELCHSLQCSHLISFTAGVPPSLPWKTSVCREGTCDEGNMVAALEDSFVMVIRNQSMASMGSMCFIRFYWESIWQEICSLTYRFLYNYAVLLLSLILSPDDFTIMIVWNKVTSKLIRAPNATCISVALLRPNKKMIVCFWLHAS